eukprot:2136985-Rhodomonas_salina.1
MKEERERRKKRNLGEADTERCPKEQEAGLLSKPPTLVQTQYSCTLRCRRNVGDDSPRSNHPYIPPLLSRPASMSIAHLVGRKEYKQNRSHLATHEEPLRLATDDCSTCPLDGSTRSHPVLTIQWTRM